MLFLSVFPLVSQLIGHSDAMTMHSKRAVLFDVDGTLSDSFRLGYDATQAVMKSNGLSLITEAQMHEGTRYTTPARFAWHAYGDPEDPRGVHLGDQFDAMYVDLVNEETAGFFPGIKDMLLSLRERHGDSVVFGALSNACGAYVQAVIKSNDVGDIFKVSLGADNVTRAKPNPDGLLECSLVLNVPPSRCIYVGDAPTDGIAARSAEMHGIGVTWGSHPADLVKAAFPETVNSVVELNTALEQALALSK